MALSLVSAKNIFAQDDAKVWFNQANAAYNAASFDSALMLYNRIVDAGFESSSLYFNLGDTYYKMHEIPMAILCYEKSLKLDPSNEDARVNLEIANAGIADKIEAVPQSFIARGWNNLKTCFSGDQWAVLSVVAFALLLLCLFLFLRASKMGWRKTGFFVGLLLFIVFALSVVFSAQLKHESLADDHAIIMTPTVTVKSSPNEASVDLFVLHEGTKVTLMDQTDGWNKIKIANGSIGWLPEQVMRAF